MNEEEINLANYAENQPSLCIPRVFSNITEERIRYVFNSLCLGKLSRVDILERKSEKGDTFKRVFIHFDKWYWNHDAVQARKKLLSEKEIKVVYDSPWFWKVSANKNKAMECKPIAAAAAATPSVKPRAIIHIDFSDEPVRREERREERREDQKCRKRAIDALSTLNSAAAEAHAKAIAVVVKPPPPPLYPFVIPIAPDLNAASASAAAVAPAAVAPAAAAVSMQVKSTAKQVHPLEPGEIV